MLALPVLIGSATFLDDVFERGHVLSWADVLLAVALTGATLVALLGLARGAESRRLLADQVRRSTAILDAVHQVGDGERHVVEVLEGLAEQACEILGVEKAVVFLRDERDPRACTAAAGHGVPADLIGRRFAVGEGLAGRVLTFGEPVLAPDYQELARPMVHEATVDLRAGGSVPIRLRGEVRGALSAGTTDPGRRFGRRELEVLHRLAGLGALALEQAAMRQELERTVQGGVEALAAAVDIRDSYTAAHSEEVVRLAVAVGERLGLRGPGLAELGLAARLHDVGKIGVPDEILRKPGPLDRREWEIVRRHPRWGEETLARIPGLEGVARIVCSEHERYDGAGYPDGLEGDQIPLESRIILACDAYHAMISDRPYRTALSHQAALRELRAGAGSQFDPRVVEVLVEILRATSTPAAGRPQ